ncbi:DUF4834 family protein [Aureitalea marina]|uniref:DUF4834 domain-containing protein n=1 Tax=Aureitalea marina TaxID=930804 RepID=A0A2S7KPE2_9FLAO|nr:DUF4834 family protein [Aureitalea marina]PQB04499.1 hypothetical protein BST85_05990 [Aureitalea marina]
MESFLKTFLIILLVYLGLRILFRLYGPLILKWFAGRLARRFERQFEAYQSQYQDESFQGSKAVDPRPAARKKEADQGEYIEYEEID